MEAGRLCRSCRLRPPPGVFWFLFHAEKEPAPQGGTLLRRPQAAKLPCNRNLYLTLGMSSIRPVGKLPSSSWLAWRICSMVVP